MNSSYVAMMLLVTLAPSSSSYLLESIAKEDDFLPSPRASILNDNRALLVCQGKSRGPLVNSLQVKCRNVRTYKSLTTVNTQDPLETTSRLLTGRKPTDKEKSILCYCVDLYTGKKSNQTEVASQQGFKRPDNNINFLSRFLPKRNRKRKVILNHSVKFIWRYHSQNISRPPRCFHDGQLLSKHEFTDQIEKVVVSIKNVSEKDAGFYSCQLGYTYSSIFEVIVIPAHPWSKWFTWFPCSTKCGRGRMVEARKCLDLKSRRCNGPTVRAVSCVAPCTETFTESTAFKRQPTVSPTLKSNGQKISDKVEKPPTNDGKRKKKNEPVLFAAVVSVCCFFAITVGLFVCIKRKILTRTCRDDRKKPCTCRCVSSPLNDGQVIDIVSSNNLSAVTTTIRTSSTDTEESYLQEIDSFNAQSVYCSVEPSFSVDPKDVEIQSHVIGSFEDVPDDNLHRQGSSKSKASNFSNFSSISQYYCSKPILPETVNPDLCSWGRFDEKGGKLTIKGTGVSLFIPQKALPKGTNQLIYIGLMSSKGLYPRVEDGQTFLSPAVICGPDGLQFERPVYLTVPHNAVVEDTDSWKPQVFSCSTVPQNENDSDQWKITEDAEDKQAPLGHVDSKSMQIMIDHFTGYVVVGRPTEIESWIVPFCTEPKVDIDCSVRIYCIPATDAALKELEVKENKLKGTIADACKLLIIENNDKDVMVTVNKVREGWSADEVQQNIPFKDIWHYHQRFPNVSFTFERQSKDQFSFSSRFSVRQDTVNGNTVTVKVTSSIKRLLSESSGYSSVLSESGFETDLPYKIPLEVRREMCYLLDPERPDFQDWRSLAESLGRRKTVITWLQHRKGESPTNEIIDWWEYTKSEEIPIPKLVQIFEEMGRHDVVEELRKL